MKRAFKVKQKAFFIIFKELSVAKNYLRPESAPLRYYHNTFTPLLANFSKTTALSSKKYICEQEMSIPDFQRNFDF